MSSLALSPRTIKLGPFNTCYATEVTRFSSRTGFGKIIIFQTPPGSKVCEVHHCALEAIARRAGREVEDGSLGRCE